MNRRGHGGLVQHPRERHLRIRDAAASRNFADAVDYRLPTASDFVSSTINRLCTRESMGSDCPAGVGRQQSEFLGVIQTEVAAACAEPGLLLGFLKEARRMAEPLVHFNLPLATGAGFMASSEELLVVPLVRFLRDDTVIRRYEDDDVEIVHNGRLLRFPTEAAGIFDRLCVAPLPSVRLLLADCGDEASRGRLMHSLSELITCGVVSLREPAQSFH